MTAAYNALRLQFLLRKRRNAGTPGTAREKHCRMRRPGGAARYRSHRKLSRQADGVKTAMPIWEAKQHCRDLIVVPASYGKYQKYSSYVREIFRDYTDQVESFGLDETWLDITGSLGLFGDPVKIAKEISDRIKRELGITVSIGVSFNKITAKLGSDYKKPDAITVIEPDNYKQIVYPLPVGDLFQ